MISTVDQYMAAVAKREHFQKLLEGGAKDFSGYGLELFELGMRSTLARINAAIEHYERSVGYIPNAQSASALPKGITDEVLKLNSGLMTPNSVFAFSPNPNALPVEAAPWLVFADYVIESESLAGPQGPQSNLSAPELACAA
jgi:hypothetical protein